MAAITITAANVVASARARKRLGRAGGTITAGMVVYEDSTDNYDFKAAGKTTAHTQVYVALNGASDGQPLEVVLLDPALNLGATLVVGTRYYCGDAGAIIPHGDLGQDDYPLFLGIAETAALLNYQPLCGAGIIPA